MKSTDFDQAAAVPFRRRAGHLEFCLITSDRGRWIFPKGFIDPGETPEETAVKEAYEEAGLHGRIVGTPLGTFEMTKFGALRTVVGLLMEVEVCDDEWQESEMRDRRWTDSDQARKLLSREELQTFLDTALEQLRNGESAA